jgi:hypothetical protein
MEVVLAVIGLVVAGWMIYSARNRSRKPPSDAEQ